LVTSVQFIMRDFALHPYVFVSLYEPWDKIRGGCAHNNHDDPHASPLSSTTICTHNFSFIGGIIYVVHSPFLEDLVGVFGAFGGGHIARSGVLVGDDRVATHPPRILSQGS